KNLTRRLPLFDRALAALVDDVHDRGLADRVLIVAMGEFGRAPRVDALAGRGHWSRAMSVVLSGGGVRGGRAIGATTANRGRPAVPPRRRARAHLPPPRNRPGDDATRSPERPGPAGGVRRADPRSLLTARPAAAYRVRCGTGNGPEMDRKPPHRTGNPVHPCT